MKNFIKGALPRITYPVTADFSGDGNVGVNAYGLLLKYVGNILIHAYRRGW